MDRTTFRILLIDDHEAIHADFRKILRVGDTASALDAAAADFFGGEAPKEDPASALSFELDSAMQGQEGFAKIEQALREGRPYALVFCDVRMPPGWDGVETLAHVFAADPDVQAVLCTAFSDYTYEQTISRLGLSSRLLILKKPFDPVEVRQLAAAQTEKWAAARRLDKLVKDLTAAEHEARALAKSLEMTNLALLTDKATAEAQAAAQHDLLGRFVEYLGDSVAAIERSNEVLRTDASSEAARASAARTITWNAGRLSDGLAEARTYGQLVQRDGPQMVSEPFSPAEVFARVLERIEGLAQLREIDVVALEDGLDQQRLLGDTHLVEVVATSLLRFAILQSDAGRVSLRARSGAFGLRLEISAPAARIAPDELSLAFEPFGGGEGLALALSRRAAQRLGGDVEASCEDGGLVLAARLPMMAAVERRAA
ncbi:MAG: hybrid sensor histidine kinase/response regulator [Planctomycetota bacterium]|nr:MAG: hybrid sensor histidine kinase/response regulator [Planctomycetota bacterium]